MKERLLQALGECETSHDTATFLAMLLSVSALTRAQLDAQIASERTPGAPSSSLWREVKR